MTLLITIERHLRRRSVPPSRFGREATGDPRFVFDLRRGREPRADTSARVLEFIAQSDAACATSAMPAPMRTGGTRLSASLSASFSEGA
jgi:hypothetical protein